ncbi:MAG: response regulator [Pirellulales bacterium]
MPATHILVVEDERLVASAIRNELEQFGYEVSGVASSADEAVEKAVATRPDLVLMDIHLQGTDDGVEAARRIHARHDVPIVYLSAFSDPQTVRRASETEAFGYLIKPYEERELQTTIEMALAKHRAERRLEETRRWLAAVYNGIADAVIAIDPDDRVHFANAAAEKLTGWPPEEAISHPATKVCVLRTEAGAPVLEGTLAEVARSGASVDLPQGAWIIGRRGVGFPVEGTLSPIHDARGARLGTVLAVRDISPRIEFERAKQQNEQRRLRGQKMDAAARVAGGLSAHLNNLLTAILGNTSLALSGNLGGPDSRERELIERVEVAAHQAAKLAERLQMFAALSGRPAGQLLPLDLDQQMSELLNDLRLRIDERVGISYRAEAGLWPVAVDELLFGQAILELALNAEDAMPEGGLLTLEMENTAIAADDLPSHTDALLGEFVRIRVSDSGHGMKPAIRAHVFEPCFTTKQSGDAAGLGLALVSSVVDQHHGWVECSSHANHGTRFDIYLPRYGEQQTVRQPAATATRPRGDAPTILLCDADPMVREVGRQMLEERGYHVLLAADGLEAVSVYHDADRRVDLAILDLNVPRLTAYAVLEKLLQIDPQARVLFSGGYFAEDLTDSGGHTLGVLTKPYRQKELIDMVARALAHT